MVPSLLTDGATGLDTTSRLFYLVHGPVTALLDTPSDSYLPGGLKSYSTQTIITYSDSTRKIVLEKVFLFSWLHYAFGHKILQLLVNIFFHVLSPVIHVPVNIKLCSIETSLLQEMECRLSYSL